MSGEVWTPRCEAIARHAARGYFIIGSDHADLVQEARIGVLKAIRTWRPGHGRSFDSWMGMCARSEVITAVKEATRDKRRGFNDAVRLEGPAAMEGDEGLTLGDGLAGGIDPCREVIGRDEATRLLANVARLSPLERDSVVRCKIHGEPYEGDKRIDNAIQRAMGKLRAAA